MARLFVGAPAAPLPGVPSLPGISLAARLRIGTPASCPGCARVARPGGALRSAARAAVASRPATSPRAAARRAAARGAAGHRHALDSDVHTESLDQRLPDHLAVVATVERPGQPVGRDAEDEASPVVLQHLRVLRQERPRDPPDREDPGEHVGPAPPDRIGVEPAPRRASRAGRSRNRAPFTVRSLRNARSLRKTRSLRNARSLRNTFSLRLTHRPGGA